MNTWCEWVFVTQELMRDPVVLSRWLEGVHPDNAIHPVLKRIVVSPRDRAEAGMREQDDDVLLRVYGTAEGVALEEP